MAASFFVSVKLAAQEKKSTNAATLVAAQEAAQRATLEAMKAMEAEKARLEKEELDKLDRQIAAAKKTVGLA